MILSAYDEFFLKSKKNSNVYVCMFLITFKGLKQVFINKNNNKIGK